MLSLATTRNRHVGDDPKVELYDPNLWTYDYASECARAGPIQSDLFYDYRTNVDAYPKWQAWMQKTQLRLSVVWGKHDLHSILTSRNVIARTYRTRRSMRSKRATSALDAKGDEIAALVREFMKRQK